MKKTLFKTFSILAVLIIVAVVAFNFFVVKNIGGTVYVAVAGPMSGKGKADGLQMVQGVQLYLDKVNREGGINGKKVKLLPFDDQNDKELAEQIAKEIVEQDKAHIVLGHLYSSTSTQAGKIYKNAKIPAISGSATADKVVKDNSWYSRVIFDNHTQAAFLANYIFKVLNQDTISVIYDLDDYGKSLAMPFINTFNGLGGKIKFLWSFDTKSETIEQDISNIVTDLSKKKNDDPGVIFLATHGQEAVDIIVPMKRLGLSYPIVGSDAMGGKGFSIKFNEFPEEQSEPGYFTDGIYAPSPILFDVANERAQKVRNEYIIKYGENPSWKAMSYYDAAIVAVDAMRKSNVTGSNLAQEREDIKNNILSIDHVKKAIDGVTGKLYFDIEGNVVKPLVMGTFNKQQLVSALTQLQVVTDLSRVSNLKQKLEDEKIIIVHNNYMVKTRIVYAGIDINEVSNLNIKNSSYLVDFYLWFRHQEGFDNTQIEFINAEKPIKLGKPIAEIIDNGMVYSAYRIKAKFKSGFQFFDYPFDLQNLQIKFRHPSLTRKKLIYVVDEIGMRQISNEAILKKLARTQAFESITEWSIQSANFYQDVMKNESTLGNPLLFSSKAHIEYSRFNSNILIKRSIISFIVKNMLPVVILLVLSYVVFFMSPKDLTPRIAISLNSLLAVAFFHLKMSSALPGIGYLVALDYAFYAIYIIIVLGLLITLISYKLQPKDSEVIKPKVKLILLVGRIGYPLIFITVGFLFANNYGMVNLNFSQAISSKSQIVDNPAEPTVAKKEQVTTLVLNGWEIDAIGEVKQILNDFHLEHPDINIKYVPIVWERYISTIENQLDARNGGGGDLLFLDSFSSSSRWFKKSYLEPLDDLPSIRTNFKDNVLEAWANEKNNLYGVPFLAITGAVFYNTKIFEKLKLEIPTTWEELLVTAQTIKDAGHVPFANGIGDGWALNETIFLNLAPNFIGGYEGRLEYLAGNRCFNDEHSVAVFQALADLKPFLPPKPETVTYYDSQNLFQYDKVAMWINNSYGVLFMGDDSDFDWDTFAIPPLKGQPRYTIFHTEAGIGINANSNHKKEARVFLEWLSNKEAANSIANKMPGYFPMHKELPNIDNKHVESLLSIINTAKGTDVRWSLPMLDEGLPNAYSLMNDNAEAIILGTLTPQQAANNLQKGLAEWFDPAQTCNMSNEKGFLSW
ncbi:extracellular solute-binding protein [Candidatus Halobeggiatoa sp. HSG11]|nr:extracellular solute-binding protein [Candidatus Halobeggiatoa sp. HSG11]